MDIIKNVKDSIKSIIIKNITMAKLKNIVNRKMQNTFEINNE